MSSINLNSRWSSYMTLVSNVFIDKYMPQADGFYVKVYLCLLRSFSNVDKCIGISDIADILETTERDVLRAIGYWDKNGLITITKDNSGNITDITFEDLLRKQSGMDKNADADAIPLADKSVTPVCEADSQSAVTHAGQDDFLATNEYTYADTKANTNNDTDDDIACLESLIGDDNFQEMTTIIEVMLERPLNNIETNLIVNLYTKYKFSADLIIHLFEYCLDNKKTDSAIIEKIGMEWATNGITTVDEAKEHTMEYSDVYYGVVKAFGINNRSLGTNEKKFILKWTTQFGYGKEIIIEACSKTLTAIHQPSFEYADKIISDWYKEKVHNINDVAAIKKKYDAEKKSAVQKQNTQGKSETRQVKHASNFNFEQRDYTDKDFDDFEKRALAKYINS